jgi:phenylpropionate dioxygenase-like ring-hydroxylating dioxygenase large terminal subunit
VSVADITVALDQGLTLPAAWYTDPAVHEVEQREIFRRTWQYAGPAAWVANPGDHFPCHAGRIPLVVVRDAEGELRALVNVCRHRGHIVVTDRGNRRALQCPYHAWTYAMDGSLRSAPRSDREPCFARHELGLLPARAEAWGPFVFVNPDPDAAPLAEALGDLPQVVAGEGLDLDAVRFHERMEWELAVNWKVAIENDLECYHCPTAHPSFSDIIDVDPDAYRLEVRPTFTSQFGPLREHPREHVYDTAGAVRRTQSHLLWPNLSINVNPGHPNVGMHVWRPAGHRLMKGVSDYFVAPDAPEAWVADMIAFDRQVGAEDSALVLSVQEGLDSRMVEHGVVLTESEKLVAAFQRMVADAIGPHLPAG